MGQAHLLSQLSLSFQTVKFSCYTLSHRTGDTMSRQSNWRDGLVYVQFDFNMFQLSNFFEQIWVLLKVVTETRLTGEWGVINLLHPDIMQRSDAVFQPRSDPWLPCRTWMVEVLQFFLNSMASSNFPSTVSCDWEPQAKMRFMGGCSSKVWYQLILVNESSSRIQLKNHNNFDGDTIYFDIHQACFRTRR